MTDQMKPLEHSGATDLTDQDLEQVRGGLTINKRVYIDDTLARFKDPEPNSPTGLQYDVNPQNF